VSNRFILFIALFLAPLASINATITDQELNSVTFEDSPRAREIIHPDWFKLSFLDLRNDLREALASGKKGIALYFGQKNCAYCKALMEVNFKKPTLVKYVRENFDIIPLDIWGNRTVTMISGEQIKENELAIFENTNFTPSLIFFNQEGQISFKMRGYFKPYRFQAMLKYIAEDYYKIESFRRYLDRAAPPGKFDEEDLNEYEQFAVAPQVMDRRAASSNKPLAVFFEEKKCHACDVLHSEPMYDNKAQTFLKGFELRQLDVRSNTPILTPDGFRISARQWAEKLDIHYAPTIVIFDETGQEVMRVDSVVKLYRLRGILNYIVSKGYKHYRSYQRWRRYSEAER